MNADIDLWCSQLGITVTREPMPPLTGAYVVGTEVFIPRGLRKREEVELIFHEYLHIRGHPDIVQYDTLDEFSVRRNEAEANLFAKEVLRQFRKFMPWQLED